ncbi:MAG: alpha/beta fold hydrolase [Syntrophomonadaceae bacterium]|nr:alpha/beta fold hydrolase [Syntrophomonadaceae bacterium]
MTYIHDQAEPFFLQGHNDMALLFLHGFTASPSEVRTVAEKVHAATGCTVSGPLLPGHGSHPSFLNATGYSDWYRTVEEELGFLQHNYTSVYVAGLSMGGLLAMYAGLYIPGLQGVITINAPIFMRYRCLTRLFLIIKGIVPYFPKGDKKGQKILAGKGRFAYAVMPLKAFVSMYELRKLVMNNINRLSVPLLVIQSMRDGSVHHHSAVWLRKHVNLPAIQTVFLKKSGHVATMGDEQDIIAADIMSFMKNNRQGLEELCYDTGTGIGVIGKTFT